jgi:hypothetical protein
VIRIPLYLAVAQWALLLCLAILLIAAFRHLGRVLGQSATPAELGPRSGTKAGRIAYERLSPAAPQGRLPSRPVSTFVPGDGEPALVAFVDPTCPSCEKLVTSLDAAATAGELVGIRTLLLTSDPPGYLQISAAFRATTLEIGRPVDRAELDAYQASATPLVVAIDAAGVTRAAGTAARPDEVRAMISACTGSADTESADTESANTEGRDRAWDGHAGALA